MSDMISATTDRPYIFGLIEGMGSPTPLKGEFPNKMIRGGALVGPGQKHKRKASDHPNMCKHGDLKKPALHPRKCGRSHHKENNELEWSSIEPMNMGVMNSSTENGELEWFSIEPMKTGVVNGKHADVLTSKKSRNNKTKWKSVLLRKFTSSKQDKTLKVARKKNSAYRCAKCGQIKKYHLCPFRKRFAEMGTQIDLGITAPGMVSVGPSVWNNIIRCSKDNEGPYPCEQTVT